MVVSLVLLLVLQGLWIRAEYRSAADAFGRENNLLFRSTMYQLADSLFFNSFRFDDGRDTLSSARVVFSMPDAAGLDGPHTDTDTLHEFAGATFSDGAIGKEATTLPHNPSRTIQIRMSGAVSDSSFHRWTGNGMRRPSDLRVMMFNLMSDELNSDTVALYYKNVLVQNRKFHRFDIIQKEFTWHPGSERLRHESSDSLPFTTSFVPLGRTAYAASFKGVRVELIKSVMPQIGFSIFITLIISLSFILVFRSLRSQQRLIEQKNDFIGNITHELKTPVATVGVALEAMKHFDVLKNPVKAFEYLDMATQELNRLSMMTDKILRTSVFDYEADISLNKSQLDLKILVEKVLSSFRLLAERKRMSLVFQHEGDTHMSGNEEHLTQMVYNLVDNAMKYAGEGPEIIVKLFDTPANIQLSVIDRGPGIAEVHQGKIFDRFYRVPAGNIHNVKGYGLGLHYVKGVVKAHGGTITLESTPGAGSAFHVKLPKNG